MLSSDLHTIALVIHQRTISTCMEATEFYYEDDDDDKDQAQRR